MKFTGFLLTIGVMVLLASADTLAQPERVSVAGDGTQAEHDSYQAVISDSGNEVAFRSSASNLVAGDLNLMPDVFLRDMGTGAVERVNVDDTGAVISAAHFRGALNPSLSDDGQRIAFNLYSSYALLFLRDRQANSTLRILPPSVSTNGDKESRLYPSLAGNGGHLAFQSAISFQQVSPASARPKNDDLNGSVDVFWYHLDAVPGSAMERLSRPDFSADVSCITEGATRCPDGNNSSFMPSLSDDGQRVAFSSYASNLVDDDDNDFEDVFVKSRFDGGTERGLAGPIVRASVSSTGAQADDHSKDAALSGNGEVVAFRSLATNLVAGDSNQRWDIFIHALSTGTTARVSVSSDGVESNHDSFSPSLSDDGRYVAFRSNASNLVADDRNGRHDIFVHDRTSGQTVRVSEPGGGGDADGHSYEPALSGNGAWIVFESDATNLVSSDTNQSRDIFRVANPLWTP